MADSANRSYLKLCVAKICQDVGFNAIQSTPLEVLTDLLQDYMTALAKSAYNYALHCGNTEPNLNHLALAFKDMGVSITELKEYVRYVDSSAVFDCPKYPVSKESQLNLLKPGSREVVTRPFHIHEHLPPMHPHLEDLDLPIKQEQNQENDAELTSPVNNTKIKTFKRPGDNITDALQNKRNRFVSEEEGRPLRELSSVMMTTSGFLSPAREGKLPEARTPIVKAEFSLNQETNSNPLPFNEQKVKKKGKLSPDNWKSDKEIKIVFEKDSSLIKNDEFIKQKRSNGGKELSKKSHKVTSVKINPLTASSISSITTKVIKQNNKIKNVMITPLNPTAKGTKVKSPKNDKNSPTVPSKELSLSPVSLHPIPSEYKIASEPDKQKLNILKKISKVKEDTGEETDDKPPETDSLSRVDVTIEFVIKREMVCCEATIPDIDFKEEVVDIETIQSPNPYETLITGNNDSVLETITHESTSMLVKQEKKKKRVKKVNKKEQNLILDPVSTKPLKISTEASPVHETQEEIVNINLPEPNLHPSSAIVPERIPSPIQIPLLPDVTPRKEVLPVMPINRLPNEANKNKSILVASEQSNVNFIAPTIKTEDPVFDLANKKKMHKKEKKEKLKKKKKDKVKNKEKSEKRKLKLEKKVKDKEKQRIKKEKKERRREKEIEESKTDVTNAVPKITLKLGPASPTNSNDTSRKIVIIPVMKKDDVLKPDRAPSPELARFSPLVPNPKQKPSKNVAVEDIKPTTEIKVPSDTIDTTSLPPCVKLDSEGNKMWFCPACGRQDDGSPMIGCDDCDAWYHWVCVGIQVPPEVTHWYCNTCLIKKKATESDKKKKSKKKNIGKKVKDN